MGGFLSFPFKLEANSGVLGLGFAGVFGLTGLADARSRRSEACQPRRSARVKEPCICATNVGPVAQPSVRIRCLVANGSKVRSGRRKVWAHDFDQHQHRPRAQAGVRAAAPG